MTFLELEKECKKRKIKKILFIVFILFIFIFLMIFIKFYKKENKSPLKVSNEEKKSNFIKKLTYNENNFTRQIAHKEKTTKQIKLVPIIDLEVNLSSQQLKKKKNVTKNIKKEKNLTKNNIKTKKVNTFIKSAPLPDFNKSISIAKEYFKNKNYELALKWAKIANMQNKRNKLSWIIASKSLFYLGKKEKAINILEIYYNFSKDKDIKNLINELRNNR